MFHFLKLDVYQRAKHFHIACKKIIREHKFDRYVNDQLARASFSAPLNIAEGSGKFSKKDRKNYFTTSRASIFECVAVFDTLQEENEISNELSLNMISEAEELSKMLYTMIKNLEE